MMRTGIIYGYTNLESGKMYIGQTLHPERRWNAHRYGKYKNGWHKDYQNNPDKYEYSIIEYDVPEDKLDEREIFWIKFFDSYNNGYNLTEGGHSLRGYKYSDEAKQKISESHKGEKNPFYGRQHSEEWRQKMSERMKGENNPFYNNHSLSGKNHPMYGKKHSEETRKKISEASNHKGEKNPMYGKTHSEETRKKLSDALKGRHWYNNGIVQIQSFECPIGFTKGMLKKIKNN